MDKLRIDKWLWAARFFKTRGVASEAVKGGKVELNGQRPKPSKTVAVGDKLTITQPHRKVEITVLVLNDKRGNAETAQTLYHIENELLNQRKPSPESVGAVAYREKGKGRPTKRDRRKIDKLFS